MTPILAALDNLLILVVFVAISALSAWLNKRKQQQEEQAEAERRARRPAEQAGPEEPDLEEALRELLGQKPEEPPVLPPVLREEPAPSRPQHAAPPAWRVAVEPPRPRNVAEAVATVATVAAVAPPPAAPMRRTVTTRPARTQEVVGWLRRPATARSAFVAAQVFGPPKALQGEGP